ncbi:uncharacterized protein BKA78DRAFT_299163 [Phyllosticta capitalensis]|uniref:uncharacterized protein n=1 Tax=Phyllosticta capitalensis TaxID=121624 RepID=UPI00312E4127
MPEQSDQQDRPRPSTNHPSVVINRPPGFDPADYLRYSQTPAPSSNPRLSPSPTPSLPELPDAFLDHDHQEWRPERHSAPSSVDEETETHRGRVDMPGSFSRGDEDDDESDDEDDEEEQQQDEQENVPQQIGRFTNVSQIPDSQLDAPGQDESGDDDEEIEDREYDNPNYGLYSGELVEIQPKDEEEEEEDDAPLVAMSQIDIGAELEHQPQPSSYLSKFNESVKAMVEQAWEDEKQQLQLPDAHREAFVLHGFHIINSMSRELVPAIIDASVATIPFAQDYPQARLFLAKYEREAAKQVPTSTYQPSIYAQYLVDGEGNGLTAGNLSRLLRRAMRYIRDDEYAAKVDMAIAPTKKMRDGCIDWARGDRRYTDKVNDKTGERTHDKNRVKRIQTLCQTIKANNPSDADPDKLTRPLSEFGYTNNAGTPLEAHKKHRNSNHLMNMLAIC